MDHLQSHRARLERLERGRQIVGLPVSETGQGLIAWGEHATALTGVGATVTGVVRLDAYMQQSRTVMLGVTGRVRSSVTDGRFDIAIRYTHAAGGNPTAPTTTSPTLRSYTLSTVGAAGASTDFFPVTVIPLSPGYYRLLVTVSAASGSTVDTLDTWRVWVSDQGLSSLFPNRAYAP